MNKSRTPDQVIPKGRTCVYVAVPIKYAKDMKPETEKFLDGLLRDTNEDPHWPEFYAIEYNVGINAPFATSELASHFMDEWPEAEWFLLWSDDLVATPQDIHQLIVDADKVGADVISGLVTAKRKKEQRPGDLPFIITGNFITETGMVRFLERGYDIQDSDIVAGLIRPYDLVGGGCALFRRRVLEALRPEKNGGLAYWTYDKQTPAYDLRIFQRIKELGFKVYQHFGVIFGHVGIDPDDEKKSKVWDYWQLPFYVDFQNEADKLVDMNREVMRQTN